MSEYTVPELIEQTLDMALRAAQHDWAYSASRNGEEPTEATALVQDAHYFARLWHEEAADSSWRCIKWVKS